MTTSREEFDKFKKKVVRILLVIAAFQLVLGWAALRAESHDDERIKENAQAIKASCAAEGISFAGLLVSIGIQLDTAEKLESAPGLAPAAQRVWGDVATALTGVLDGTLQKPPKCGEKFNFELRIEDQKTRCLTTDEKGNAKVIRPKEGVPCPTPTPTPEG